MCHIESHHTHKETSSNCCKAVQCHISCVLHSSEVEIHWLQTASYYWPPGPVYCRVPNPSVVELPAFRAFVENLNPRYSVPSRKYLRSTPLPAKTADKTATIKTLFSSVKCVSLTLDLWSSRDMWSFMGITCHCISGYQLHSILLACSRFQRKPSADHILE